MIFELKSVKIGLFMIGATIWLVIGYFYYIIIFFSRWIRYTAEYLNITNYTDNLPKMWVLPWINEIRPLPNIDLTLAEGILLFLLLTLLIVSGLIIKQAWSYFKSQRNQLSLERKIIKDQ